jgi:hypothetical protein
MRCASATICWNGWDRPESREVKVRITPVHQNVPVYSEWIGTTVGFIDAKMHSKVAGYLMVQDYPEGSLVKTGDLLFEVHIPNREAGDECGCDRRVDCLRRPGFYSTGSHEWSGSKRVIVNGGLPGTGAISF